MLKIKKYSGLKSHLKKKKTSGGMLLGLNSTNRAGKNEGIERLRCIFGFGPVVGIVDHE